MANLIAARTACRLGAHFGPSDAAFPPKKNERFPIFACPILRIPSRCASHFVHRNRKCSIVSAVIQYDFGRQYPGKFIRKNTVEDNLGRPNKDVRNLLAVFETDRGLDGLENRTAHFLRQLQATVAQTRRRGKYDYPGPAEDKLFKPTYRHKHYVSPTCICRDCFSDVDPVCDEALSSPCADLGCDDKHLITRERLRAKRQSEHDSSDTAQQPAVHVGAVASGDTVMKSAADRDRISREAGVIAFEMEGAGVWDEVPCIVVKGVCDYADSHKHKGWQNFAAATAASTSKAILEGYIQTDEALKASAGDDTGRRNASTASIPQQDGAANASQGPVFHGPISGQSQANTSSREPTRREGPSTSISGRRANAG